MYFIILCTLEVLQTRLNVNLLTLDNWSLRGRTARGKKRVKVRWHGGKVCSDGSLLLRFSGDQIDWLDSPIDLVEHGGMLQVQHTVLRKFRVQLSSTDMYNQLHFALNIFPPIESIFSFLTSVFLQPCFTAAALVSASAPAFMHWEFNTGTAGSAARCNVRTIRMRRFGHITLQLAIHFFPYR